ncbi:hypothetical protein DDD_2720 [Nonlabens dokdonensis DSW-6]|uniref:Uncharacterized protein n=1 Tax=Nonlabens dokdonensis (strain DSM 17205 / KCTC 12402 / DSW-6) TaxID=592029 RepID=L7WCC2_NONDD|nr:hypothetical protein DDD_2720 [Nonlabens dokdonensis DSW-6]
MKSLKWNRIIFTIHKAIYKTVTKLYKTFEISYNITHSGVIEKFR